LGLQVIGRLLERPAQGFAAESIIALVSW
jgi:hypothetical protein